MVENFPMSNDPLASLHMVSNSNRYHNTAYMEHYPVASERELLAHYMYGSAGPFIDLLVYVDLGVGLSVEPVDFEDEDEGMEAKALVEKEFFKRDFQATMKQFATYYLVLGRACLVKTYDKSGGFFFDEKSHVNGLDCIDPMTLQNTSIKDVMQDNTGNKEFIQNINGGTASFSQDRVCYRANNNFSKYGVMGFSSLQRCVSELRLLSCFPSYRDSLARKYSNLHRILEVKTKEFGEIQYGKTILNDSEMSKEYLNDISNYYALQEAKGSTMVVYDWMKIKESSFAGKEVKLNDLELQTLSNIAFKLNVPLDLLRYSQVVNRSVMEVLADIFVNKQGAGARNDVYTPIIEGVANEILEQYDIMGGRLKVEYNPFLSENSGEVAAIVKDLLPTGCITKNEARSKLNLPPIIEEDGGMSS